MSFELNLLQILQDTRNLNKTFYKNSLFHNSQMHYFSKKSQSQECITMWVGREYIKLMHTEHYRTVKKTDKAR